MPKTPTPSPGVTEDSDLFYAVSVKFKKSTGQLHKQPEGSAQVLSFVLASGKVVFCMCAEEDTDSFVVINPCVLISNGDEITGDNITKSPVAKLMKSGVLMVMPVDELHRYYVLKHMQASYERCSDFFTNDVRKKIDAQVCAWEKAGYTTSLEGLIEADPSYGEMKRVHPSSMRESEETESITAFVPYRSKAKH